MRVEVYDLLGRRVMELSGLEMQAGAGRQIQLDASSLASGSYIYRVHAYGAVKLSASTPKAYMQVRHNWVSIRDSEWGDLVEI